MSKLYRARSFFFLFCIDAKFCKKIFVGKLLTRSTRFTCFCTAQTSIFQKIFVKLFRIFWQNLQKFVIFEFFSLIFAQILMKFGRNFADNLEKKEKEKGGRWGPDQHRLLRSLVRTKVASIHPLLRRRAALADTRRWWSILFIGAQSVVADCILCRDSPVPTPTTVLPLASVLPLLDVGTEPSRMP